MIDDNIFYLASLHYILRLSEPYGLAESARDFKLLLLVPVEVGLTHSDFFSISPSRTRKSPLLGLLESCVGLNSSSVFPPSKSF